TRHGSVHCDCRSARRRACVFASVFDDLREPRQHNCFRLLALCANAWACAAAPRRARAAVRRSRGHISSAECTTVFALLDKVARIARKSWMQGSLARDASRDNHSMSRPKPEIHPRVVGRIRRRYSHRDRCGGDAGSGAPIIDTPERSKKGAEDQRKHRRDNDHQGVKIDAVRAKIDHHKQQTCQEGRGEPGRDNADHQPGETPRPKLHFNPRLPGFTAGTLRKCGGSLSASQALTRHWISGTKGMPNFTLPPERSTRAATATGLAPTLRTAAMHSLIDRPVETMSSTMRTGWPLVSVKLRRSWNSPSTRSTK